MWRSNTLFGLRQDAQREKVLEESMPLGPLINILEDPGALSKPGFAMEDSST